jgi:hypothetical protein
MKCPCGCGRDVPHLSFWATRQCGKRGRKLGIYMPTGVLSQHEVKKKLKKVMK